jgi:hypothetical protein
MRLLSGAMGAPAARRTAVEANPERDGQCVRVSHTPGLIARAGVTAHGQRRRTTDALLRQEPTVRIETLRAVCASLAPPVRLRPDAFVAIRTQRAFFVTVHSDAAPFGHLPVEPE